MECLFLNYLQLRTIFVFTFFIRVSLISLLQTKRVSDANTKFYFLVSKMSLFDIRELVLSIAILQQSHYSHYKSFVIIYDFTLYTFDYIQEIALTHKCNFLAKCIFSVYVSFPMLYIVNLHFQIRSKIRNPWSHCNIQEWDKGKFATSFTEMGCFISSLDLKASVKQCTLDEIAKWETNGI